MTAVLAMAAAWVLLAIAAGLAGRAAVFAAFAIGVAVRDWLHRSIDEVTTLPDPRKETAL